MNLRMDHYRLLWLYINFNHKKTFSNFAQSSSCIYTWWEIVSHHYVNNKFYNIYIYKNLYFYICKNLLLNFSIQQNHCCLSLNMNRIYIYRINYNSVRWITRLVIRWRAQQSARKQCELQDTLSMNNSNASSSQDI